MWIRMVTGRQFVLISQLYVLRKCCCSVPKLIWWRIRLHRPRLTWTVFVCVRIWLLWLVQLPWRICITSVAANWHLNLQTICSIWNAGIVQAMPKSRHWLLPSWMHIRVYVIMLIVQIRIQILLSVIIKIIRIRLPIRTIWEKNGRLPDFPAADRKMDILPW